MANEMTFATRAWHAVWGCGRPVLHSGRRRL
jgi:hypothetical protein